MRSKEFTSLVTKYKDGIYRLSKWIVKDHDEAQDIMQETFIRLWNRRSTLKKYRNLESVFYVTAKNLALNALKKKKKMTISSTSDIDIADSIPEESADNDQGVNFQLLVKRSMDQLSVNQRIVFELRDIENRSIEEIAKITNATENNVRVLLSRARQKIRKLCIKEMNDEYRRAENTLRKIL
ncbi:MAG: sigma-70 family RNA polymerase sigma factor [Bacteroidota bacterium]